MDVVTTSIPDVILFKPRVFEDARGFFMETYRDSLFAELGLKESFVQDNHSVSVKGVLRGLHYQVQQPQGKLVRVVAGEVYDVAVDLRRNSPTFGKYVGLHLSAENKHIIWVPPGFAHGFLSLSERAEFIYKCTDYYAPEYERTLLWNDPELGIEWPELDGIEPILSEKDLEGQCLNEAGIYP